MNALLTALQNPTLFNHPVDKFQVIETHISWVLLTGDYAYKIKKPVNLGFLDFSTLEKRHQFCLEELRLNRRLTPQIYLDVVAITGSPAHPEINGSGAPFEYAVLMQQFDPEAQMDRMLDKGELQLQHMDQLADLIAQFHQRIITATSDQPYGSPELVHVPVAENFSQINALVTSDSDSDLLDAVKHWSDAEIERCYDDLLERKQSGFIRECHGDMHLRNIAIDKGEIIIFDGIEFSDTLRWIDVMSEIAFVVMDLYDRQQPAMAARLLNRYLEITGDYAGLSVFRYYLVYRAMVRAKVDCIRAHQASVNTSEQQQAMSEYHGYLALAKQFSHRPSPYLIITHGLSGSGKTHYTQSLLEKTGCIRIRSDCERKRLYGLHPLDDSTSGISTGIYTAAASHQTYHKLHQIAGLLLTQGWSVIVDATFLQHEEREAFAQLAHQRQLTFIILDFTASDAALRQRIQARYRMQNDASEANLEVLDQQYAHQQPLSDLERSYCVCIDSELEQEPAVAAQHITAKLQDFRKRNKPPVPIS